MVNNIKNDNVWTLLFQCFPKDTDIVTMDVMKKGFTDRAIEEAICNSYIRYIGNTEQSNVPRYKITKIGIKFRNKE